MLVAAWTTEPAIVALGFAAVAAGVVTAARAEARYVAIAILGTVFGLAYFGEAADDGVYETIAGVSLVPLVLLSLIGARGRRAGRRASGGAPVHRAPSAAPSTLDAER